MGYNSPDEAKNVLNRYIRNLKENGVTGELWVLFILHEIALMCEEKNHHGVANLLFDIIDIHEAEVIKSSIARRNGQN